MRRLGILAVSAVALVAMAPPAAQAELGISHFDGSYLSFDANNDPVPAIQAGSRPNELNFSFKFDTLEAEGTTLPDGTVKDVVVDLPPGIAGDFTKLPRCTTEQLIAVLDPDSTDGCPIDSQVGVVTAYLNGPDTPIPGLLPIYNMIPPRGTPADFGVPLTSIATLRITPSVRTGGDYGIRATSADITSLAWIFGVEATLWGVPSDSSHDTERLPCGLSQSGGKCPVTFPRFPLLTMPTSCAGPMKTTLRADSWQRIGKFAEASFLSHDEAGNPYSLHGCALLGFAPSIVARPQTTAADTPTGARIDLHFPQNDNPDGNATAHLRDVELSLPEGFTVNPASAAGLAGCSSAQVDLKGPNAARCPNASKIGTATAHTSLIDDPLHGAIYLATPFDNPFDSLVALYLSVDDPQTGVVVKLAGEVEIGPGGRLTTRFEGIPQFPIEDVEVELFGGPRASLKTPALCGAYATRAIFTPWSSPHAPEAAAADPFQITSGPNGAPCANSEAERPHDPRFEAGAEVPVAGAHTPMVVRLARHDGSQELSRLDASLPPGVLAKLAGVSFCPEASLAAAASRSGKDEQAAPSCPAQSRVGSVTAAAGAGPAPYHVQGAAYLAGPYKGAPLSLAVMAPAVAGPFDLGTVVVRTALNIDPVTGQASAATDPFPTELENIPLSLRSAEVNLDRPDFALNPTSCEPKAFGSAIFSSVGALASPSTPFQVGGCRGLGFEPRIAIDLKGGTKRGAHPAFKATVMPRPGDANISRAQVRLPRSAFLDQSHIRTICTRVQFAAKACPPGSVYGKVTAYTPLLDEPLRGNVILRSSNNNLPDMVFDLKGIVDIEASARIDSVKGGVRATFAAIPDAPISKVVLEMQGGNRGLIVNSRDICAKVFRADARLGAHNGKQAQLRPKVKASCKKKRKGKKTRR